MKSHVYPVVFTLFLVCVGSASAQNERLFRDLLNGELLSKKKSLELGAKKVEVQSLAYQFDLNKDGLSESIVARKIDGVDYVTIHDYTMKELTRVKLQAYGLQSKLYKIQYAQISSRIQTLILHFFEGFNEGQNALGTARVYFLSWEQNNFKKMSLFKGPAVWVEKQRMKNSYYRRKYQLNILDYNFDGKREISIRSRDITRVYLYDDLLQNWTKV